MLQVGKPAQRSGSSVGDWRSRSLKRTATRCDRLLFQIDNHHW
ncbi:hypothetical protein FDUTEX481_09366 [Tolypothrix sp. PCC 7601]|nr:hypothetical protein FDUTEX481_09366 [Tolypothrix sp. PCC 7601]